MEATEVTTQMTFRCSTLLELEVPMINTMVTCLGSEHRRLNYATVRLAFAATRLASDPGAVIANQRALRLWEEIRHDLWSHLQIEDGLVPSWGEAHHAISGALLATLKNERQKMRKLMGALRAGSSGTDREPQTAGDRSSFAQTLLALARTLDSHVERYDGEVLPSILRALFHK
jgi:Hemerythrin HHE cation binding domain